MNRVWTVVTDEPSFGGEGDARALRRLTHQTIRRVTDDIEGFRFNTLIAALMEMTNGLYQARDAGPVDRDAWNEATRSLLLMMAPIAPHISEELWERTGGPYSIHLQSWPEADAELAREDEVTLVVQVNGKVRHRIQVPVEISEERAKELALGSEQVRRHLEGKQPRRVIYVPGKLVNVVV
jgi:leucyl-tRNA synthetase